MDFAFNNEQQQLKKMIHSLATEKLAPLAKELDKEGGFPAESFSLLGRQGLMGLLLPSSVGGAGADIYSYLIAIEEVAKGCPATAFLYNTHLAASFAVLVKGSPEQKAKYLAALASGEMICGMAGTESGGGSNPFSIKTFAQKDGEDYILNGNKVYISGAGKADLFIVLARTGNEPSPSSFSAFLIEKGTNGVSFGKLENKLGMRSLPTGEIIFENCRVGADALLGPVGGGLPVMGTAGGFAALGAGAIALGLAQAAVDETKGYLTERTVTGKKLAEIQAVQLRFADMLIELNAIRSLLYHAAYDKQVSPPGPLASIFQAKIFATEKALHVIDQGMQLHGAYGYSKDFPLEKYYRDARALSIHFGTNDVIRTNMSKLVLGV